MKPKNIHLKIFHKLLDQHGPRKWWPAKTRFEIIVGAVLTQNVSWRNAKKAIINLKKAGLLSPRAIISVSHKELADRIKSSRFYNQKAHKLKAFSLFLMEKYGGSLNKMFREEMEDLRGQLLSIRGIGEETADCILLYAGKKLSFVSDAYTTRFLQRYGLLNGMKTYREIRKSFMENLPEDVYLYNEYHALIDHHGSGVCQSKPNCQNCSVKVIDKNTRCQHAVSNNLTGGRIGRNKNDNR
jgi:endonuclease III related protein